MWADANRRLAHNYDNSLSLRLANRTSLTKLLDLFGLLKRQQLEFIEYAVNVNIRFADATKHIPEPTGSVEVLYSSHMLEHLDKGGVERFLSEARRILCPGGIIRIAVPNIRYHVDMYLTDGDADAFISRTLLTKPRPNSFAQKLAYILAGDRHHQWMYDGASLCKLLSAAGFQNAKVLDAGTTGILNPGSLNLSEGFPESVFVEAIRAA